MKTQTTKEWRNEMEGKEKKNDGGGKWKREITEQKLKCERKCDRERKTY